MANPNLRLVTPATENRTVTPQRPPNADLRTREHLTADEVKKLIEAAKANRRGYRDALMVLLAYRHGLRAAEVGDLRWEQVDFKTASLHIRRAKNGTPATHPLSGREMGELRRHQGKPDFPLRLCLGTRGAAIGAWVLPHGRAGGNRCRLGIKAHAHMLRHACGYKLANDGHDTRAIQAYMGHRNIQNTTRYTATAAGTRPSRKSELRKVPIMWQIVQLAVFHFSFVPAQS